MIFTRHACERYLQFHLIEDPAATEDSARAALEFHQTNAVKTGIKTHRGDPVWNIEALGIEVVTRRSVGDPDDVCVTVLPPPRFRGLTPLQAERVQLDIVRLTDALVPIEQELADLAAVPESPAGSKSTKETRQLHAAFCNRVADLKHQAAYAYAERDTLTAVLKTMRCQLTAEFNVDDHKRALRIAVRYLWSRPDAAHVLADIAEISPGLASKAFAYHDPRDDD